MPPSPMGKQGADLLLAAAEISEERDKNFPAQPSAAKEGAPGLEKEEAGKVAPPTNDDDEDEGEERRRRRRRAFEDPTSTEHAELQMERDRRRIGTQAGIMAGFAEEETGGKTSLQVALEQTKFENFCNEANDYSHMHDMPIYGTPPKPKRPRRTCVAKNKKPAPPAQTGRGARRRKKTGTEAEAEAGEKAKAKGKPSEGRGKKKRRVSTDGEDLDEQAETEAQRYHRLYKERLSELRQLRGSKEGLEKDVQTLGEEVDELKAKLGRADAEKADLSSEAQKLREAKERLEDDLQKMKEKVSQRVSQSQLREELSKARQQVRATTFSKTALDSAVAEARRAATAESSDTIKGLRDRVAQLEGEAVLVIVLPLNVSTPALVDHPSSPVPRRFWQLPSNGLKPSMAANGTNVNAPAPSSAGHGSDAALVARPAAAPAAAAVAPAASTYEDTRVLLELLLEGSPDPATTAGEIGPAAGGEASGTAREEEEEEGRSEAETEFDPETRLAPLPTAVKSSSNVRSRADPAPLLLPPPRGGDGVPGESSASGTDAEVGALTSSPVGLSSEGKVIYGTLPVITETFDSKNSLQSANTSTRHENKKEPATIGDPCMARAVKACLDDPSITLLDALIAGGFDYPASKQEGVPDKDIKDSRNVSLRQRKNQLGRRLRNHREKYFEEGQSPSSVMPFPCKLNESEQVGKTRAKGSTGDPRMDRAVEAKVANPSLSLLEALVSGGFDFPESGRLSDRKTVDTAGVSLFQRKNQLCRRLRKRSADDPRMSSQVPRSRSQAGEPTNVMVRCLASGRLSLSRVK